MTFTIPLSPVTKKKSQQIFKKASGRPFITPSKAYKQYEEAAGYYIRRTETIDYLVNVKMLFYMPTHRRVDLVNLQEAILDVLVKQGVLSDDNSNIVATMDGSAVLYDKVNPRTEVIINKI